MEELQFGIEGIEILTPEAQQESMLQGIDHELLEKNGISQRNIVIKYADFEKYLKEINYEKNYPSYIDHYHKALSDQNYDISFVNRKLCEQYLAIYVTAPSEVDEIIDIAASNCPFSLILKDKYNVNRVLHQDLCSLDVKNYPYLNSPKIEYLRGNAVNIPVEPGTLTAMYLLNAWEHFQAPSDVELLVEAERCLKQNGKLVILPLETARRGYVMTDPNVWDTKQVYEINKEPVFRKHIPIRKAPYKQVYDQIFDADILVEFSKKTPNLKYEIVDISFDQQQPWLDKDWKILIAEKVAQ